MCRAFFYFILFFLFDLEEKPYNQSVAHFHRARSGYLYMVCSAAVYTSSFFFFIQKKKKMCDVQCSLSLFILRAVGWKSAQFMFFDIYKQFYIYCICSQRRQDYYKLAANYSQPKKKKKKNDQEKRAWKRVQV